MTVKNWKHDLVLRLVKALDALLLTVPFAAEIKLFFEPVLADQPFQPLPLIVDHR